MVCFRISLHSFTLFWFFSFWLFKFYAFSFSCSVIAAVCSVVSELWMWASVYNNLCGFCEFCWFLFIILLSLPQVILRWLGSIKISLPSGISFCLVASRRALTLGNMFAFVCLCHHAVYFGISLTAGKITAVYGSSSPFPLYLSCICTHCWSWPCKRSWALLTLVTEPPWESAAVCWLLSVFGIDVLSGHSSDVGLWMAGRAGERTCSGHTHFEIPVIDDVLDIPIDTLFQYCFTDSPIFRRFLDVRRTFGEFTATSHQLRSLVALSSRFTLTIGNTAMTWLAATLGIYKEQIDLLLINY